MSRIARLALVLAAAAALAVGTAACSSTASPSPSSAPSASAGIEDPADRLAATLPEEVSGTALEREGASLAEAEQIDVDSDLIGRLNNAFKTPSDVLLATAIDPTGSIDLRMLALRVIGADPGAVGLTVAAWAESLEGGTVGTDNVGKPVTTVTRDGEPTIYVYQPLGGDVVYVTETADAALAEEAMGQLP